MPKPHKPEKTDLDHLKQSELQLAQILDIAVDAIISIDENQIINLFNQGAERIFGYKAREIIGKPLDILLPESKRNFHHQRVDEYAKSSDHSRLMSQRAEIYGLKKDGTQFPARAAISKFTNDNEVTLTVYLRDLSKTREIEDVARKHREQLTHVSRAVMLGEISSSLAHEINQPLTAILSNAQALRRQIAKVPGCTEESIDILTEVINDTKRAGDVINHLKTLLRPGDLKKGELNLNQVVAECEKLLGSELIMRHVHLTSKFSPDLPLVSANHVQLQQVLLNLLSNSVEAMKNRDLADRQLLVQTRLLGSGLVEVSIKDNGVGFKNKSFEDILEPFFTTKKSGLGMGLAITQSLVAAHGGQLRAENNKGAGATFYVTLPAVVTTTVDGLLPKQALEQVSSHQQELLEQVTVFIIDDDQAVRKALARLISSTGHAVETFSSTEAFLERGIHDGYGCLVVDLHMPGQSGLELQAKINEREYSPPIIFITGAGDTKSGVLAMKRGAVDYLLKPVNDEKLIETVTRALEIDREAQASHKQVQLVQGKIVTLTLREIEIMELVVQGQLNKQIAFTLGISEKTVKVHRGRVMYKLEVRSLADLVRVSQLATDNP